MEQQDRQGEYHDQTEDQVQVFLCLHFVRRFGSSTEPVWPTDDLRHSAMKPNPVCVFVMLAALVMPGFASAAYATPLPNPLTPAPDGVLTIAPPPRSSMSGDLVLETQEDTAQIDSDDLISLLVWCIGCRLRCLLNPRVVNAKLRRPKRSTAAWSADCTSCERVTSQRTAIAWPPATERQE
jgi:hypothetical protein